MHGPACGWWAATAATLCERINPVGVLGQDSEGSNNHVCQTSCCSWLSKRSCPASAAGESPLLVQFRIGQQQAAGSASPAGSAAPAVPAGPEPCCGGCGATPSGSVVLRACSACHAVKYCSAACQLKDWGARHSAECGQLQQLAALLQQTGAAGSAGRALDDASTRLLAAALH